ncbi:hypothetical protein JCM11641_002324 [Rhodosporidiobolus odoratus]
MTGRRPTSALARQTLAHEAANEALKEFWNNIDKLSSVGGAEDAYKLASRYADRLVKYEIAKQNYETALEKGYAAEVYRLEAEEEKGFANSDQYRIDFLEETEEGRRLVKLAKQEAELASQPVNLQIAAASPWCSLLLAHIRERTQSLLFAASPVQQRPQGCCLGSQRDT